jgi:hypothetical protein
MLRNYPLSWRSSMQSCLVIGSSKVLPHACHSTKSDEPPNLQERLTCPSSCTTASERVYVTLIGLAFLYQP